MKLYAYILTFQFFFAPLVFAQESTGLDIDQYLLASCKAFSSDPEQISAIQCNGYIRGFLAGTWNIDNVTMAEIKKKKPETFSERAYRVRVGTKTGRINGKQVTYFCSPAAEPEVRIMKLLSKDLIEPLETIESLNIKIYEAIKAVCPSDEEMEK